MLLEGTLFVCMNLCPQGSYYFYFLRIFLQKIFLRIRLLIFKYAYKYSQFCVLVQADSVKLANSSIGKEWEKGKDGICGKAQKVGKMVTNSISVSKLDNFGSGKQKNESEKSSA